MTDYLRAAEFPSETDDTVEHRVQVAGAGYAIIVGKVLSAEDRQYLADMYDRMERTAARTLGQIRALQRLKGIEPLSVSELAAMIDEGEGNQADGVPTSGAIVQPVGHKLFTASGKALIIPMQGAGH